MRRLAVASALLATLLIGSLAVAPAILAAGPTDAERGTQALTFMLDAQRADGSLDASIAETSDLVVAAADLGFDPATVIACSGTSALEYVAAASDKVAADAGKTGKAILAVRAAHLDPAAFRGRDLLARLTALYKPATGAYGDGSTFSQAFGILGLEASGAPVPAEAVAYLRGLQDTDGSWNFKAAKDATDGDTNSTAIALTALGAAGDHATETKAFEYLHTQQLGDGGFPYQNISTWGPPASDPDSDSLVIQALVAAGQSPTAAEWSKGSSNALTHLRSTQAASGGFTFPGNPGPDAFTTSQVVPGLLGVPYARPTEFAAGRAAPRAACVAAPTPVPSTAAASATHSATAPATAHPASAGMTPPPTTTGRGGSDGGSGDAAALLAIAAAAGLAALLRRRATAPRR